MRVYGTVVWWKVRVKPDGLPDLFRFKSVDWIIPLNDDRALLSRDKLGGSATAGIRAVLMGSVRYYHKSCCFDSIFKLPKPGKSIGGGIANYLL